jgi:GTP-binding protein EngB required for normal cell division/uncharacterized protein (DUF697 family)
VRKRSSGLSILVAAAVLGYGLIALPPAISDSYDSIYRLNPVLAQAYLVAVAALATTLAVYIVVKTIQMWRRSRTRARPAKLPSAMTQKQIRSEIEKRRAEAADYLSSIGAEEREQLTRRLEEEERKLESETLEIAAFGTVSGGKSSLLNALAGKDVFVTDARGGTTVRRNETDWPGHGKLRLVDTPGLGEMHGSSRADVAIEAARSADLLLYVTDGVLRDFEHEVLRRLAALDKRMLVCLNKEDTFRRGDIDPLLSQMRQQLHKIVPASDFVAVRASPSARIRVRITPDGAEHEELVTVEPDVSALAERMMDIIGREGPRLLLANLLIRARGLVSETKSRVAAQLDKEARELVGRYMWQAGGAAALSPFPLLDLAAGLGVSYKMVLEIAAVYRQKMDLDSAREMVAQAGKNLVASAGTALATPTVAAVAASALKTIPGAGTIAGGLLQGLVQALVTRWIGLVFIDYFRQEMTSAAIPALAKAKWGEVTRPSELARLVQEGMRRFGQKAPERTRDAS